MSEMSERANMTGAHALAAALHRHGVRDVFGQSIPSSLLLAAPPSDADSQWS